jgi:hypothetical protein
MEPAATPLVDRKSCNARHVMGFDRFCRKNKIGRVFIRGMWVVMPHCASNDTNKSKQVINGFDSRPRSDLHTAMSHDRIVAVSLCLRSYRDLVPRGSIV